MKKEIYYAKICAGRVRVIRRYPWGTESYWGWGSGYNPQTLQEAIKMARILNRNNHARK